MVLSARNLTFFTSALPQIIITNHHMPKWYRMAQHTHKNHLVPFWQLWLHAGWLVPSFFRGFCNVIQCAWQQSNQLDQNYQWIQQWTSTSIIKWSQCNPYGEILAVLALVNLNTAKKVCYMSLCGFCSYKDQISHIPPCILYFAKNDFSMTFIFQSYTKTHIYQIVYHIWLFLLTNTAHIPIALMYTSFVPFIENIGLSQMMWIDILFEKLLIIHRDILFIYQRFGHYAILVTIYDANINSLYIYNTYKIKYANYLIMYYIMCLFSWFDVSGLFWCMLTVSLTSPAHQNRSLICLLLHPTYLSLSPFPHSTPPCMF